MKRIIMLLISTACLMFSLAGCASYTCYKCDTTTSKAYYDFDVKEDRVLCEDCARKYWMPLPYENYRVK